MAAPQLTDGEIEITFDQKTDDSYVGFLFRSDEDMNSLEVARHPDNIYYLALDTDISIVTYSMIRLLSSRR